MAGQEDQAAIVVTNLRKSFGSEAVLRGIDLTIHQGETVVVLGRSGTGKSVLLKLIIGLQRPDDGSIHVHGQEVTDLPLEELNTIRTTMGFLFQEAALYDSLSIEDNVAFPLRRLGRMPAHEQDDRVRMLLSFVDMAADADKVPAQISGGMKKRVGLARALALEPDILLFDEPTAGLDPITASEIEELMLKLKKEHHVASVVVTHDLRGAKAIADRLAIIHEGTIVSEGTFADLKRSTHPFVSQFLGGEPEPKEA